MPKKLPSSKQRVTLTSQLHGEFDLDVLVDHLTWPQPIAKDLYNAQVAILRLIEIMRQDETSGPFERTAILADPNTMRVNIAFQEREDYEAALAFFNMGDLPEEPRETTVSPPKADCADCGLEYGTDDWLDTVLTLEQWKLIGGEQAGILCANCIIRRASRLPNVVNLSGRITFRKDFESDGDIRDELVPLRRSSVEPSARPLRASPVEPRETSGKQVSDADLEEIANAYDQGPNGTFEYDSSNILKMLREVLVLGSQTRCSSEEPSARSLRTSPAESRETSGRWPEYTNEIGEAGSAYLKQVSPGGYHLSGMFFWHELWDALNVAAYSSQSARQSPQGRTHDVLSSTEYGLPKPTRYPPMPARAALNTELRPGELEQLRRIDKAARAYVDGRKSKRGKTFKALQEALFNETPN